MAEHASGKSMALSICNGDTFTLKAAQKNERNIFSRLKRSDCTVKLYQDLWRKRTTIEAITAHHLGRIDPSSCIVQDTVTWIKGQFNTCIHVHVHESDGSMSKKIFRCPLARASALRHHPTLLGPATPPLPNWVLHPHHANLRCQYSPLPTRGETLPMSLALLLAASSA